MDGEIIISDNQADVAKMQHGGYVTQALCSGGSCRFRMDEKAFTLAEGDCMIVPQQEVAFNVESASAEFDVEWEDQLEFWDMYEMAGEELKRRYDAIGMRMQYCRYYAKGGVRFTPAGGQTSEAHGDMIYEYAYMGMPDPAAHV